MFNSHCNDNQDEEIVRYNNNVIKVYNTILLKLLQYKRAWKPKTLEIVLIIQ